MVPPASSANTKVSNLPLVRSFGKVAVLSGGDSGERKVSLKSGRSVLAALCHAGVDAHLIDTADYPLARLRADGFDRAFLIVFGGSGENGELQAILEHLRIPFTGSGVLTSALGMDKLKSKLLWRGCGLPVAPFVSLQRPNSKNSKVEIDPAVAAQIDALGFPVFVKPNSAGSSLGISRVTEAAELPQALESAFEFDSTVLIEKFLHGPEFSVGIVGDRVLPSVRIQPAGDFYDYEAKYESDQTGYFCPAGLDAEREVRLQQLAQEAWTAIGGRGWGRIDVMADGDDFWLLEANTTPGMSDRSLLPMAARQVGWSMSDLVVRILESAD